MSRYSDSNPLHDSTRFVEFLTRLNSEYYAIGAGLREESNISEIKESYAALFSKQTVLAERVAFLGDSSADERRLAQLRLHERGSNYLSSQSQALVDKIETWKLQAVIDFEGKQVPYNTFHSLLPNLSDRSRRSKLGELYIEKTQEIHPLVLERWRSAHDLARNLSYQSYVEAYSEWKGLEINQLVHLANEALHCTDDEYKRGLENYAKLYVGLDANELQWFDFPALLRGTEWDQFFPSQRLVATLWATAHDLHIELDKQKNIRLDLEARKNKSARAFCAGVRVPEEIYIVAKPAGGHRDYEAVLHEAGHAFHFGLTEPGLPWELRYLLDDTVAETFAYLIAGLLRSPEYLGDKLGILAGDASAFVSYANFIELYMFRRYCAKTLFEVELHTNGEFERASKVYNLRMKEALDVEFPGDLGIIEMDPGLYSLQYLSAWFLHASMLRHLQSYGPLWFKSVDCSSFLKSLWSRGATDTADSLLLSWGDQSLTADALCSSLFQIEVTH